MYHVCAQGVDERMLNVHYYYYYLKLFCFLNKKINVWLYNDYFYFYDLFIRVCVIFFEKSRNILHIYNYIYRSDRLKRDLKCIVCIYRFIR